MRLRYRHFATSTLRATISALSKPGLAWLFSREIGAMELELLHRDLPLIAEDSGGYLVEWILGVQ